MTNPQPELGSYRDREGRIYYVDGEVYRALSETALSNWRALLDTKFLKRALEQGTVVATREVDRSVIRSDDRNSPEWSGALHHERIPFISYPNEWSYSMLRDAALLQLDLLQAALNEGFILKDSSAYNVQWRGTRPVFIDVPSFEPLRAGEPWVGYLQFCQQFLYPLLLTSYKNVPFQPWLRASLDGIMPGQINPLFGFWQRFRKGVFTHVYLQSKLADMTSGKPAPIRKEARDIGFSSVVIRNNVRGLRKLINGLEWKATHSEWADYDSDGHNYTDEEHRAKEAFVERSSSTKNWTLLWDLGCNTGRFTRIASRHADTTIAMDIDPLVIDRFFRELKGEEGASCPRILPLVNDLVDPSPARGWRGQERSALLTRQRPDLILALALIHHLVIGRNVPMAEVIDWLGGYRSHLVIEFPTRKDSMVNRLLLNKEDHYHDYNMSSFEQCLGKHFEILERDAQPSGERVLYFARHRSID